jgi:hypothetical protein
MDTTNKALASPGLMSYRYKGRYGWIMIAATDNQGALNEAKRSTTDFVMFENLQVWNGASYQALRGVK